jgi:hypothetical protein
MCARQRDRYLRVKSIYLCLLSGIRFILLDAVNLHDHRQLIGPRYNSITHIFLHNVKLWRL